MASSSSSQQPNQEFNAFSGERRIVSESSRLFDVFINHRGPDVKQTLAIQLYNSLHQLGIRAFLDSEEKELGDSFPSTIETAISSASIHVAIFSKGYADSPWCLAELVLMLQSQAKIIPMFYGVKPSDLRHIEKGAYAEAFIRYEVKGRYLDKLCEWKEALQSLSLIAGEESDSFSDCDCQNIVAAVQKEVQRKARFYVAQYPVGLKHLVKDFERHCLEELVHDFENKCGLKKGKDKAKVVGIFGMGGVGKTTLAKELFNRKSSNYSRASFLFDVREASERRELPSLQRKLLKDLFDKQDLSFTSTEEGTSYLNECLKKSPANLRFLIFVDDTNHVEQLNALLVMETLERLVNSLVIVTTRDAGVLISAGITAGYHLRGMAKSYGSELFCWHAFNQPNPASEYEELVDSFVEVCGGLPLSLQVLGRHVHGRSKKYWRSELTQVRKILPNDVKKSLRISFEALNAEEKQIFMDIACFFGGTDMKLGRLQNIAKTAWEGSGWNVQHSLQTLRDKCLLEENSFNDVLRMHDHLRDLGREIALELSPPQRLWRPQDLKCLELKGLRNIMARTNLRCLHSIFDDSMNSQVTFFLGQSDNLVEMPSFIPWLELRGESRKKSPKTIPSWIPLQGLQCLKIDYEPFETLWNKHGQAPSHLKRIDIIYCYQLRSVPEISKLAELVLLHIDRCPKLEGISLGHLNCLEKIIVERCDNLRDVLGISNLMKLVELEIVSCDKLEFDCLRLRDMECLQSIIINVKVKHYELDSCRILETLKISCEALEQLIIRGCPELEELPVVKGPLERIIINECGKLKCLQLDGCHNFKCFTLPTTLIRLCIRSCRNLQKVEGISGDLPKLMELYIIKCPQFQEFSCFPILKCLEKIELDNCNNLQNITLPTTLASLSIRSCRYLQSLPGITDLTKLTELHIIKCPQLQDFSFFPTLKCLEKIELENCKNLQKFTLQSTLISLSIRGCGDLRKVEGTSGDLPKLKELSIKECPRLKELPSLSRLSCLRYIDIESWEKVKNITDINELHALRGMQLLYFSNAIIRHYLPRLKTMQLSYNLVIGKAVDGAASILNERLFYEAGIGADAVTDIVREMDIGFVPKYGDWEEMGRVIVCYVVVIDSSTSAEDINDSLPGRPPYPATGFRVRQGEWIITMVAPYGFVSSNYRYYIQVEHVIKLFGTMKGFLVKVKKSEECKGVQVLRTITDRLYHL